MDVEALARESRHDLPSCALAALGLAVTGTRGYLASSGYAIRDADAALPVIALDGSAIREDRIAPLPDPVLSSFGLRLGRVEDANCCSGALHALAVRIGLLYRMLDLAYCHRNPRVSFGQRTLSHQLVKAAFAEAHASVLLLLERAKL